MLTKKSAGSRYKYQRKNLNFYAGPVLGAGCAMNDESVSLKKMSRAEVSVIPGHNT